MDGPWRGGKSDAASERLSIPVFGDMAYLVSSGRSTGSLSNVAQARSSYGLFTARWRSCAASIGLNVIAIPAVGEYLTLLWFSSGEGIKVSGTVVCLDALHDLGVVRPGILG